MPHSMERPCRRREPISRMSSTIILVVCTKPEKDYTSTRVSRYSVQEIEYSQKGFDSRRTTAPSAGGSRSWISERVENKVHEAPQAT
jgi:hypothetical protein